MKNKHIYRVGDIVRIKNNLIGDNCYGNLTYLYTPFSRSKQMKGPGTIGTVKLASMQTGNIQLDDGFYYSEDMIEPYYPQINKEKIYYLNLR